MLALHAGPDAYNKAAAAWRAKFPLAALPDPRKDFLVCEGGSGRAKRMRGPANFSRSFAEYMARWLRADISYDKGDRMLEVAANIGFNPEHFPAIGHKTLKGVQLVYAWPFTKRLFRGNCNRQDFVFVRPRGSDHALFHPSPDNVWYCRCLLFSTIVVRTNVMGSVSIK